jgi:hypothetical protein
VVGEKQEASQDECCQKQREMKRNEIKEEDEADGDKTTKRPLVSYIISHSYHM